MSNLKDIQESETLSLEDFYDKYGADKRLELNFGERGFWRRLRSSRNAD